MPVVGKRNKTKEEQSELVAGQIWEVEDNMGTEACDIGRKEEHPATCTWLVMMHLPQILVLVSARVGWCAAFHSILILMM